MHRRLQTWQNVHFFDETNAHFVIFAPSCLSLCSYYTGFFLFSKDWVQICNQWNRFEESCAQQMCLIKDYSAIYFGLIQTKKPWAGVRMTGVSHLLLEQRLLPNFFTSMTLISYVGLIRWVLFRNTVQSAYIDIHWE